MSKRIEVSKVRFRHEITPLSEVASGLKMDRPAIAGIAGIPAYGVNCLLSREEQHHKPKRVTGQREKFAKIEQEIRRNEPILEGVRKGFLTARKKGFLSARRGFARS